MIILIYVYFKLIVVEDLIIIERLGLKDMIFGF